MRVHHMAVMDQNQYIDIKSIFDSEQECQTERSLLILP